VSPIESRTAKSTSTALSGITLRDGSPWFSTYPCNDVSPSLFLTAAAACIRIVSIDSSGICLAFAVDWRAMSEVNDDKRN